MICALPGAQVATAAGPSSISGPAVLVAVLTGVTAASRFVRLLAVADRQDAPLKQPVAPMPVLATQTVLPSGDITMAAGDFLMLIAGSIRAVAVRTAVTWSGASSRAAQMRNGCHRWLAPRRRLARNEVIMMSPCHRGRPPAASISSVRTRTSTTKGSPPHLGSPPQTRALLCEIPHRPNWAGKAAVIRRAGPSLRGGPPRPKRCGAVPAGSARVAGLGAGADRAG